MISRRKFIQVSGLSSLSSLPVIQGLGAASKQSIKPIVLSTWDAGIRANKAAWNILSANGSALDAVEAGVKVTESEINCCVGLGANPDRDGIVTLDASIMDHQGNCGAVAALERIKHPIAVARKVMEKTPHTLLVGQGAQQFALSQGFTLEPQQLSENAEKEYKKWLKKSEYKPVINIENKQVSDVPNINAPQFLSDGSFNHDTIGMIAMDSMGNLSGSCTTSGMGFKMRGRIGDSPIIGAGLYVDNEVGAATATGQGEDIMRICGSFYVVEMMAQGLSPENACKKAVEKLVKLKGSVYAKKIQACFIAINKQGAFGGFALQKGFTFAVYHPSIENQLFKAKFLI